MPTPTDLVTDLPADFEVFGQAVDTSLADLKGGTTGQILSKATNADMDFTWITNDVGDITAVTVSSPLTGGGTSGSVSVGILNGTTSNLGAVQLSDSTSSTSTTLAATANAVKTTYDLADAAIAKSVVTTAGDIIYRNATVPTRLGIGTAGQVLTVNSGATAPEWTTVSASSGPAFRVYRNTSAQTFSAATYTKVQFNAESFDTDNCFDSTTNYRFTPTKAGYYSFSTTLTGQTGGFYISAFYKNGTINGAMRNIPFSAPFSAVTNSTLIYCNGSTDYVEVYAYGSSGSPQVDNGVDLTYFTGVWIRS